MLPGGARHEPTSPVPREGPELYLFFLVMIRTSLKRKRWQTLPEPLRKIPPSSEESR